MQSPVRRLRPFAVAAVVAAATVALVAGPTGAGPTPSATVTPAPTTIAPGGTTTVTVVFTSSGTGIQAFTVKVAPGTGAQGAIVFSDPQSSTTSSGGGGFNCFVSLSDDSAVDCLYNNGSKQQGDTATLVVTAKASDDADGTFVVTATDDTTEPVELGSADIEVQTPAPPADVVELTPTFTG